MSENVGPNKALTSHLTKMSEINKNQTESEDSNDPDLELDSEGQIKSFILKHSTVHRLRRKKGKSKS